MSCGVPSSFNNAINNSTSGGGINGGGGAGAEVPPVQAIVGEAQSVLSSAINNGAPVDPLLAAYFNNKNKSDKDDGAVTLQQEVKNLRADVASLVQAVQTLSERSKDHEEFKSKFMEEMQRQYPPLTPRSNNLSDSWSFSEASVVFFRNMWSNSSGRIRASPSASSTTSHGSAATTNFVLINKTDIENDDDDEKNDRGSDEDWELCDMSQPNSDSDQKT